MLSSEQFAEWKEHPITKEVFLELRQMKQTLVEKLSSGDTISSHAGTTHGDTCMIVGQITGINQLLEISFDNTLPEDNISNEISGY